MRIDPAGDQRGGHFERGAIQFCRVVRHGNRMKIGEEEQALAVIIHLVLHPHPVADRAEIIAEVEIAGGLDAGNDAHDSLVLK